MAFSGLNAQLGFSRRLAGPALVLASAICALLTSGAAAIEAHAQAGGSARVVQSLEEDATGVQSPVGLAYSHSNKTFYALEARSAARATDGVELTTFSLVPQSGRPVSRTRIPARVQNPINVAFDDRNSRLLLLGNSHELFEVEVGKRGGLESTRRRDATRFGLREPQGMAVDPGSGAVFILDANPPRIVRIEPRSSGALGAAAISEVDLGAAGLGSTTRGLAFDPSNGHLYLADTRTLVELTQAGDLVSTRELSGVPLTDSEGLIVAPSRDLTDDPGELSVYMADSGGASSGQILELSLTPVPAVTVDYTSTLVRTVDLGALTPPSPDPSGITYVPASDKLVIVDGEVEETVGGITHFDGANVWELTRSGSIIRTANISKIEPTDTPMTNEPTGVTRNPTNGHYFVTEDGGKRVYDLNPGADGLVGTSDDSWTFFRTDQPPNPNPNCVPPHDNCDPEGIAYDTWNDRLFVADGVNREIYQYTTDGTLVGHFDVQQYGVEDPETVEFNPANGTLFVLSNRQSGPIIIETTTSGALLQTTDVSAAGAIKPAGLAYTIASDGSNVARYYIVDRGIDNDSDPNAVDGKLFEMTREPPTVLNPSELWP